MTAWNLTSLHRLSQGLPQLPGSSQLLPGPALLPFLGTVRHRGCDQHHTLGTVSQSKCHQQPSAACAGNLSVSAQRPDHLAQAQCPQAGGHRRGQAKDHVWAGKVLEPGSLSSRSGTVSFTQAGADPAERGVHSLLPGGGDGLGLLALTPLRSVELP